MLQNHPEHVLAFVEQGCVVQVTASSYTGRWGSSAPKAAEWLLKHDAMHVLAADAHGTEDRAPVLSGDRDAVAKIVGTSLVLWWRTIPRPLSPARRRPTCQRRSRGS